MKRLAWQGMKIEVVDDDCDSVILEIDDKRLEIVPTRDGKFRISVGTMNGDIIVSPNASNSINVDVI